MNTSFIKDRITQLRMAKGVSEYKMSLDLGHSKGYVQGISSGRILPSMSEFLYICDYFEISPAEFFSQEPPSSLLGNELLSLCASLSPADIQLMIKIAKRLGAGEGAAMHEGFSG